MGCIVSHESSLRIIEALGVPVRAARRAKKAGRRPRFAMPRSWNAPLLIWASNMPMEEITAPAPVQ